MSLQDDLATLKAARGTGTMRVKFADGREVQYRTYDEIRKAIEDIESEIAAESGVSRPVAGFASFRRN